MFGHEKLISMRKQGFTPISIFVDDSKVCSDWFNPGERYGEVWESESPHICILPEETLELLDLRFSVGLVVHIGASSERRAKELLAAFKEHADTIVSCYGEQVEGKDYFEMKWSELWHKYSVIQ